MVGRRGPSLGTRPTGLLVVVERGVGMVVEAVDLLLRWRRRGRGRRRDRWQQLTVLDGGGRQRVPVGGGEVPVVLAAGDDVETEMVALAAVVVVQVVESVVVGEVEVVQVVANQADLLVRGSSVLKIDGQAGLDLKKGFRGKILSYP